MFRFYTDLRLTPTMPPYGLAMDVPPRQVRYMCHCGDTNFGSLRPRVRKMAAGQPPQVMARALPGMSSASARWWPRGPRSGRKPLPMEVA